MRAVLLIELEPVRPGAGAAMIRVAAKARAHGVASFTAVCFLHDARPTFAEAYEACVAHGASEVTLVPYALTVSPVAAAELHRLCVAAGGLYPHVTARLAAPLGDHAAVAQVVMQRASEADYVAAHPFLAEHAGACSGVGPALRPLYLPYPGSPAGEAQPSAPAWRPLYATHPTALLLAAGGPMAPITSRPLYSLAEQIRRRRRYAAVRVCFVAGGLPSLATTLDELAARAIDHALAVPCALHHAEPLVAQISEEALAQRTRQCALRLIVAEQLGYDRRLVEAIGERVDDAYGETLTRAS